MVSMSSWAYIGCCLTKDERGFTVVMMWWKIMKYPK